jgi:uncharacterized protein
MMADWSRSVDVERLADHGDAVAFDVALAEFPRLRAQLASGEGRARGRVELSRERGVAMAHVVVQASLPLVCQRCLRPVHVEVESESRVALVADFAAADRLDSDVEPVMLEEGRVVLRDLVEEELLLAVPLVPRHEQETECGLAPAVEAVGNPVNEEPENDPEPPVTQKPFAGLGELLKRGP